MKRLPRPASRAAIAGALATLLSCAPQPAAAPAIIPELAGRTPGPAQRCVNMDSTSALRIIDSRTALYGSGATVWVNHFAGECPGRTSMDILVTHPTGSQYCRGDIVQSVDPVSHIPGPTCILGDFIPYRR
ncbi:MAG: hypothetical protein V4502_01765 [Pseudomonadota bacterium]